MLAKITIFLCLIAYTSLFTMTAPEISLPSEKIAEQLTSKKSKKLSVKHSVRQDEESLMNLHDQLFLDQELYESASKNDALNHDNMCAVLFTGADTTVYDSQGRTPVHMACAAGNIEGLKILGHYEANFRANDAFFHSALHYAVPDYPEQRSPNRMAIIEMLVLKGVSKYMPLDYSPLKHAVVRGDLEAVKALVCSLPPHYKLNAFGNVECSTLEERIEQEAQFLKKYFNTKLLINSLYCIAQQLHYDEIKEWVNPELPVEQLKMCLLQAAIKRVPKLANDEKLNQIERERQQKGIRKRSREMLKHIL